MPMKDHLLSINPMEHPIVTRNDEMLRLLDIAERIAPADATVLITGETGTGKELFARYIHEKSNRDEGKFYPINCAELPETLVESILFGHERGAFTGATAKKTGVFVTAGKGNIYLDEISELNISLQAKLLRVLQEREVTPVGSTKPQPIQARFLASSNRDLHAWVQESKFRSDLYYRLNTIEIHLPPLRKRHDDIPLLVDYFLEKYDPNGDFGITVEARKQLEKHHWPGNVRELEGVIWRAVLLEDENLNDFLAPVQPLSTGSLVTLDEIKIRHVRSVIAKCDTQLEAANVLGVTPKTLRSLLRYI